MKKIEHNKVPVNFDGPAIMHENEIIMNKNNIAINICYSSKAAYCYYQTLAHSWSCV
jgi:hypothetical protein